MHEEKAFDTIYVGIYIIGYDFYAISKIWKFNDFETFLHHVITIDIFNKINTVWFDEFDDILLQLWIVFSELYCLLHNPASIAVLRELKDMIFDDFEESMPMGILSIFKQFLEDIISKLVLS
jgi:hypothetical protein